MYVLAARTDLIVENNKADALNSYVFESESVIKNGIKITRLKTSNGNYSTLEAKSPKDFSNSTKAIIQEILSLLPKNLEEVLIIGLGNSNITPDALGPLSCEKIIATRHIKESTTRISVLSPGVLGQTGLEASEVIDGIAKKIKPDALLIIDALAAKHKKRICKTIQITDSGIKAASGVGGKRQEISQRSIGIPTIAIGVPTVVCDANEDLVSMPQNIDILIELLSETLAASINEALHN